MRCIVPEQLCHCGQPLHYTDQANYRRVRKLVDLLGEYVTITIPLPGGTRSWKVQRHYIALHGIKATDLVAGRLGFEEVTAKNSTRE